MGKVAKTRRPTPFEKRQSLRTAAMPEVKRLVRRFGRQTVAHCVGQLKEHEKSISKLNALKREVARLEKDL